jgi:hypothetical protein
LRNSFLDLYDVAASDSDARKIGWDGHTVALEEIQLNNTETDGLKMGLEEEEEMRIAGWPFA